MNFRWSSTVYAFMVFALLQIPPSTRAADACWRHVFHSQVIPATREMVSAARGLSRSGMQERPPLQALVLRSLGLGSDGQ